MRMEGKMMISGTSKDTLCSAEKLNYRRSKKSNVGR